MECAVCSRRKRSSLGTSMFECLQTCYIYANHTARSDPGSLSPDNLPSVSTHKMGTGGQWQWPDLDLNSGSNLDFCHCLTDDKGHRSVIAMLVN